MKHRFFESAIWIFLIFALISPLWADAADSREMEKQIPLENAGKMETGIRKEKTRKEEEHRGTAHTRKFIRALEDYAEGRYQEAVNGFLSIAEDGVRNPRLYYNLGNACLKDKELGRAILWYERAKKMDKNDPDLCFNLDYALSLVKDEKEEAGSPFFRVLFFWNHLLSAETIQWTAILLNLVFWGLLAVNLYFQKPVIKTVNTLIFVLLAVFALTACYNYYDEHFHTRGVVLPEVLSVRSGPADDATELFVLHSGTKVEIEKELKNHCRIRFSKDKMGWVPEETIGKI